MSIVEVIAIDIMVHNSFLTIMNALSSNDFDLIKIKDTISAKAYKNLDYDQKSELSSILNDMCRKKR